MNIMQKYTDEMSKKWAETLLRLPEAPSGYMWEPEVSSEDLGKMWMVTVVPRLKKLI